MTEGDVLAVSGCAVMGWNRERLYLHKARVAVMYSVYDEYRHILYDVLDERALACT